MAVTRAFKSGNSQAVRIPAELAYGDMAAELVITRVGDVITIHPARTGLAQVVAALRAMPRPLEREIREPLEMPERGRD